MFGSERVSVETIQPGEPIITGIGPPLSDALRAVPGLIGAGTGVLDPRDPSRGDAVVVLLEATANEDVAALVESILVEIPHRIEFSQRDPGLARQRKAGIGDVSRGVIQGIEVARALKGAWRELLKAEPDNMVVNGWLQSARNELDDPRTPAVVLVFREPLDDLIHRSNAVGAQAVPPDLKKLIQENVAAIYRTFRTFKGRAYGPWERGVRAGLEVEVSP